MLLLYALSSWKHNYTKNKTSLIYFLGIKGLFNLKITGLKGNSTFNTNSFVICFCGRKYCPLRVYLNYRPRHTYVEAYIDLMIITVNQRQKRIM